MTDTRIMMVDFPYFDIPKSFTRLLKTNFKDKRDVQQNLDKVLIANPALKLLIIESFSDRSDKLSMTNILNSFGWKMVRDKMALLYLQRFKTGRYDARDLDLNLVKGVLDLEDKFFDFTTKGISRTFLLGFYLKMCEIHWEKTKLKDSGAPDLIESVMDIFLIIKLRSTKSIRLDWLLLIVWHFQEYFGRDDLKVVMNDCNYDYEKVYDQVDSNSQRTMMRNLVTYGASIHDKFVMFNGLEGDY